MRIAITGGAGFIGANLTRHLLDHPKIGSICVLDDLSTGLISNIPPSEMVDFIEGSILDTAVLHSAFEGSDAIVHLAARPSVPRSLQDPRSTHDVNVTGTLNVLETARALGGVHTIIASSSSVYGANETLPKSEHLATRPLSPYAASKLATESYALAWASSFGLPVLALRFFNVYGPLQRADHAYAAAIPRFIDAQLRGETIKIFGNGAQSRDFTYVDSLCDIIREALIHRVTFESPVNAAFGTRSSLLDIIEVLRTIGNSDPRVEFLDPRPGDVLHSQADSRILNDLFPQCVPTDLEAGLQKTFDWLHSQIV